MATFETRFVGRIKSASSRHLIDKFFPIILFILAIVPRLAAIGRYVTPDEPAWVLRSIRFREAILSADWANTLQSGHPGVTTTWLGSLGIQLKLWLQPESQTHLEWLKKLYWLSPENGEAFKNLYQFLEVGRVLMVLVNCLGLVIIYLLARRRLGRMPSLVAGCLLALDPFLAGLSGLLHLDGLLATLTVMTILLVLPVNAEVKPQQNSITKPVNRGVWFIAGITTALAFLTKSPGLFLLVIVPAIWAWQIPRHRENLGYHFQRLGLWVVATTLVVLLLLPAVWADPGYTYETIRGLAARLVVDSVRPAFFLGQPTLQPGSAFYPLALLFRLSPMATVGFSGALFLLVRYLIKRNIPSLPTNVLWLLIFGFTFILFLNMSAKRYDRYLLPTLYAFILVAGWVIAFALRRLFRRKYKLRLVISLIVCAGLVLAYLVTSWPFPMTAFNWLAGGPAVAFKVLPVDWGEGTSSAALLAAEKVDAGNQTLFATNLPAAAPFFPGTVRPLDRMAVYGAVSGDYIIYQTSDWQADPSAYTQNNNDMLVPEALADWSVIAAPESNGLTRAVLMAVPPAGVPQSTPLSEEQMNIAFDHNVSLLSATILPGDFPTQVLINSLWQLNQPADFQIVLELQNDLGQTWLKQEVPLLNEVDQPTRFWSPGIRQDVLLELGLPVDLPPGKYSIFLSLFDLAGSRLGVFDSSDRFGGVTAVIGSIDFEPPADQPPVPVPIVLNSDTELTGMNRLPDAIGNGEILTLDLWWQVKETASNDRQLAILLDDSVILQEGELPDGPAGQTYHIKPSWRIPEAQQGGNFALSVQLIGEDSQILWEKPVELGTIEVVRRNRIFELPAGIDPLHITVGQIGYLQQVRIYSENERVLIDLTWQASRPNGQEYTTFIHIIDQDGEIVKQVDRPPIIGTSHWLPGQVISDQFALASPGEGRYTIATGFYNPVTGHRLPLFDRAGRHYTGDAYRQDLLIP